MDASVPEMEDSFPLIPWEARLAAPPFMAEEISPSAAVRSLCTARILPIRSSSPPTLPGSASCTASSEVSSTDRFCALVLTVEEALFRWEAAAVLSRLPMPPSFSAASASCEEEAERMESTEAVMLLTETRVTLTASSVLVTVAFRSVNSFCTSSSGTASATLFTSAMTDCRLSMVSFSPSRLFLASSISPTRDSAVAGSAPWAGMTAPMTLLTTSAMVSINVSFTSPCTVCTTLSVIFVAMAFFFSLA